MKKLFLILISFVLFSCQSSTLWQNGIIPFEFSNQYTWYEKVIVEDCMKEWHNKTGVTFIKRTTQQKFVYIIKNKSEHTGSSSVGCTKVLSPVLELPKGGFSREHVLHELGHIIGLNHEHQRPDRDNFIIVFKNHIEDGKEHNFDKMKKGEFLIKQYRYPYNYDSIMHYSSWAFRNGPRVVTMLKKGDFDVIYPPRDITEMDAFMVRQAYFGKKKFKILNWITSLEFR